MSAVNASTLTIVIILLIILGISDWKTPLILISFFVGLFTVLFCLMIFYAWMGLE